MGEQLLESISEYFGQLEVPRIERNKLHPLLNIIVITVFPVICGSENWVDMALYGNLKKDWLGEYLDLTNGILSHDTFGRLFRRLQADAFQACFWPG